MSLLTKTLKRTCTAFVVGLSPRHLVQAFGVGLVHGPVPEASPTKKLARSSRLFSTFEAPVPPQSKGEAVYQDINVGLATTAESPASRRKADGNAVFVVTGASRGIGLQFVKTLISETKGTVVACCRDPSTADGLLELIAQLPAHESRRVRPLKLDLEDQLSIEETAKEIRENYKRVDMLLNVAGLLGNSETTPGPERSIAKIEREWLEKSFSVNVFGPVMLSKELAPVMAQNRRGSKDDKSEARPNSIIANLSARVGSISDNGMGGWYSYRMSKSALNQATRTMAHELKRKSIWCIALHPGTTDTDLSKPFQKNVAEGRLFPVDFTVESLLKVIDSMSDDNSGGLYDWAGKAIPF